MTFRIPFEERLLGAQLANSARIHGDKPFITVDGRGYSYREAHAESQALARGLKSLGIKSQDPVVIMLENNTEFVMSWFALMSLNAISVPANTAYMGELLAYLLKDSAATTVITSADFADRFAALPEAQRSQIRHLVVARSGAGNLPAGAVAYESLLQREGPVVLEPSQPEDLCLISYTSGTTGPSKGVLMPQSHNLKTVETCIRSVGIGPDDVIFTSLPMFHGMSRTMGILPAMVLGAQVHLGPRFSASSFWQDIHRTRATVAVTIFSIPPILKGKPPSALDRGHRLRVMFNAHHDAEFEERFGVHIVEAHGMTEMGLTIHTDFPDRKIGSAGRAHEDWEIALLDEHDRPVPIGKDGELCMRPRQAGLMMRGYLNKPDVTLSAMTNLWFHSGDLMRQDEEGFFFFSGRKKERIRRRGENISSYEIESAASAHPAIAECAALGVPAGDGEDDVYLVAVPRDGAEVAETALFDFLKGRLPKFMVPRYIEMRDALPKTGSGKIEKYKLAENLPANHAWDSQTTGSPAGAPRQAASATH